MEQRPSSPGGQYLTGGTVCWSIGTRGSMTIKINIIVTTNVNPSHHWVHDKKTDTPNALTLRPLMPF